jgi:dienelactone hydrolase
MKIEKINIQKNDFNVPAIIIYREISTGAAVIIHGYGGCKEEQLGLACRISESGLTTCAIDLCGHGENNLPLNDKMVLEANTVIDYLLPFGKVAAVGHSLGARVALLSKADFAIGISPALSKTYGQGTIDLLKNLRSYRVKETQDENIFKILNKLPLYQFDGKRPASIIYGERDIPEIKKSCMELKSKTDEVIEIKQAFHGDIFLLEETFFNIKILLKKFLY